MPPNPAHSQARVQLESGPILLRWHGDVAVVTLNRPEKLNSFTRDMHRSLVQALDHAEAGGARALLLTGAGRGFCAGQDLADLDFSPDNATDLGELIDTWFNPLVRRLQALPLPVIAAVNGTAAGAGANLALACDIVLAAKSASFIQAFVKIGLAPDSGGTWLLPKRVGLARALGLAMTGDKLSAEDAEKWGLVWKSWTIPCCPNRRWPWQPISPRNPRARWRRSSRPCMPAPPIRWTHSSISSGTSSAIWAAHMTTPKASMPSWKSAHHASPALDPDSLPLNWRLI